MTHGDCAIGDTFVTTSGTWRCTDIGTRTVMAIKVSDGEDASWFRGPQYAVAKMVCDENDWNACWPDQAACDADQ